MGLERHDQSHERRAHGERPEAHGASNYHRPGDEWGTGFRFGMSGCWHVHLTRDDTAGDVWLNVAR